MKKWLFGCFLLIVSICFPLSALRAEASASVVNSPYYRNAYVDKIPADNTFIMRNGKDTTIEKLSGEVSKSMVITGLSYVPESSVLIRNVGFYQGKNVNVKATVTMLKPLGTEMITTKDEFLRLRIFPRGVVRVTYDFLDDQLQPFPLKTTFNEMGLNKWKDLTILHSEATIDALCAAPNSAIQYTEDEQGLTLTSASNEWRDDETKLAITTKEISSFAFILKNNDSKPEPGGVSEVQYLSSFFPGIEFPYAQPQQLPVQKITNNEVTTSFQQTIPWKEKKSRLPKLSYKVTNLPQNQFQLKNVSVKDFYGNDRTAWFEQQLDEQGNLTISAKSDVLGSSEIYDNSYLFTVHHTFIGSRDNPVNPALLEGDCLKLQTQLVEDIGAGEQAIGISKTPVDYSSSVTVNYVDEQNRLIIEPGHVNGLITETVDLSTFYPQIDGYYPLRETKEQDQVTLLPQDQTISHRYRKGQPLLFTLKNMSDPLMIPRFSKTRAIAYDFSHDPKEAVQVVAACGAQRQIIKQYEANATTTTDTVSFKVPAAWFNQQVAFYLENQQGQRSAAEVRTLVPEKGPQLLLPEKLNFGIQSIPSRDSLVTAVNQKNIRVEDQSQLEKSRWTVKVRIDQPLKNEDHKELHSPLRFQIQGQETILSNEDAPIWSGSGSATLAPTDRLQLALQPSDYTGTYQGRLVWTMEDAPQ